MNSKKVVLDASAVIAYAKKESGHEKVAPFLRNACISSVNYSEVLYSLMSKNTISLAEAQAALSMTNLEIIPFTADQAVIAASFHEQSLAYGLSLGDRACLALAIYLETSAITADSIWKKLKLKTSVIVIR